MECPICLEVYNNDIYISKCGHCFHDNCYFEFLVHNSKKINQNTYIECPLCRDKTDYKELKIYLIKLYDVIEKELENYIKQRKKFYYKLMVINFKSLLFFKKEYNLRQKEEDIMMKIEIINMHIYEYDKKIRDIRRLYCFLKYISL
jgi:hypothetical protein